MWPLGGLTMVAVALLPSAWHWLRHSNDNIWHAAGSYAIADVVFAFGSLLFLYICVKYGESRGHAHPAPYPGAWVESDGHQQTPRGFAPGYLGLALIITLIIPSAVSLYILLVDKSSSSVVRPLICATLAPYLMVFIPQILLETKYLNRNFMTPMLPILYMYYRLWQFIRSLSLAASYESHPEAGPAAAMLKIYLMSLLMFWVFDTACTMVWMPWMYDWQLQDPNMLQKLTEKRQQEQLVQQGIKAAGKQHNVALEGANVQPVGLHSPAGTATLHGMLTRSKSRTPGVSADKATTPISPHSRRRVVAVREGNFDSYGFGA